MNIDYTTTYFCSISTTPSLTDTRQIRIDRQLKGIGDTVFILLLGINGTIVNFCGHNIFVVPYNLGHIKSFF